MGFALRAECLIDGRRWVFGRYFRDSFQEDRRWLYESRRRFDYEFAADLAKSGRLYRIQEIYPRQAALIGPWSQSTSSDYRDDGDWLDEALFPSSDMEVWAKAYSETMSDFVRRQNTREE